jgi:hypothetical protein
MTVAYITDRNHSNTLCADMSPHRNVIDLTVGCR